MYDLIAARQVTQDNLKEVITEMSFESIEQFEQETGCNSLDIIDSYAMYDEQSELSDDQLYIETDNEPTEERAVLRLMGRAMGNGKYVSSLYLDSESIWVIDDIVYVSFEF